MSNTQIGINGAVLDAKRHGISRYVAQLLRGFERIDTDRFDFTVFTDAEIAEGDSLRKIDIDRSGTVKRVLWDTTGFVRTAKSVGMDVIHSPDKGPIIKKTSPVVATIHDLLPYLYPKERPLINRKYWQFSLRRQATLSDAIVTVSESTKNDLLDLFDIDGSKIHITPLGTNFSPPSNAEIEDVMRKYDLPELRFNALYVGNYNERKNVDRIVEACRELHTDDLDIHLLLAGSNPPKARLTRIADEFCDEITFLGYVPDDDLEALYGAADVFVYPSIYEGFGLPVLEAMACGTPVITSNTSSLPEVVGDAGLTINPRDTSELTDAIDQVHSDDRLQRRMEVDGQNRASKFTWDNTARETICAYDSVFNP